MKLGSLFSGGGLGDFGFMAAGMEISWQCEIDKYCQKILALRYPDSKKYTDIHQLKGNELEKVDIITGGFPCQPFSYAGKQGGSDDNRYLWPEMLRVIKEHKPRWVIGENVPGIINMAIDCVCTDLEKEGYSVQTIVFPSHALGAWHKRDRVWIVAYCDNGNGSTSNRKQQEERTNESDSSSKRNVANANILYGKRSRSNNNQKRRKGQKQGQIGLCSENFSNTRCEYGKRNSKGLEENKAKRNASQLSFESGCERFRRFWESEPSVGRVAHGVSDRVHRLKLLGNGQVSACTYVIGKMILEIEQTLK